MGKIVALIFCLCLTIATTILDIIMYKKNHKESDLVFVIYNAILSVMFLIRIIRIII